DIKKIDRKLYFPQGEEFIRFGGGKPQKTPARQKFLTSSGVLRDQGLVRTTHGAEPADAAGEPMGPVGFFSWAVDKPVPGAVLHPRPVGRSIQTVRRPGEQARRTFTVSVAPFGRVRRLRRSVVRLTGGLPPLVAEQLIGALGAISRKWRVRLPYCNL